MLDRPVSLNEAEAMLDARLDRATALRFREILAAWAPGARQRAFFSARVAAATALSILHRRCRQVLEGDMTDAQAVRLIQEWFLSPAGGSILASMGFAPVRDARGVAELASCARLALVIRTNVLMAQECGRYAAWRDQADAFPYARWRCGHAEHHREEHLRRDGRVFRFDHPIWTQSPPGGEFNCRCRRELLTQRDLDRLGLVPEPDDFPFAPSSLGFDPSRPVSDTPVVPGAGVLPELAERALRPPAEPLPDPHLPFPRVDLGALVAATGQPADGAPPPGPASAIPGLAAEPPLIRPGDGDTPRTMRGRAAAWLRGHRDRLAAWVRSLMRVTDQVDAAPSEGRTRNQREGTTTERRGMTWTTERINKQITPMLKDNPSHYRGEFVRGRRPEMVGYNFLEEMQPGELRDYLADAFVEAQELCHRLQIPPIRGIVKISKDPLGNDHFADMGDGILGINVEKFQEGMRETEPVSPPPPPVMSVSSLFIGRQKIRAILFHEVGHHWLNMIIAEADQENQEAKRIVKRLKRGSRMRDGFESMKKFKEWFAENVALWAMGHEEQSKSKIIDNIMGEWRKCTQSR